MNTIEQFQEYLAQIQHDYNMLWDNMLGSPTFYLTTDHIEEQFLSEVEACRSILKDASEATKKASTELAVVKQLERLHRDAQREIYISADVIATQEGVGDVTGVWDIVSCMGVELKQEYIIKDLLQWCKENFSVKVDIK